MPDPYICFDPFQARDFADRAADELYYEREEARREMQRMAEKAAYQAGRAAALETALMRFAHGITLTVPPIIIPVAPTQEPTPC